MAQSSINAVAAFAAAPLRSAKHALNGLMGRQPLDQPDRLVFIHIGKCGGASLEEAVSRSPIVAEQFRSTEKFHIRKPAIRRHAQYLIVVRNPISRALSAYNWRRKIVVETGLQQDRFPGEHETLQNFASLNDLAEALYDGDTVRPEMADAFRSVHHLREDIGFYLTDLLAAITPDQVFGVIATENFDADANRVLGVAKTEKIHSNKARTKDTALVLSDLARANLRRFLAADYAALKRLNEIHPFAPETFDRLMA